MTYSVYIDFEHRKIKADNPVEAKKKAVKMIERNKAQLIRVVENESQTLEYELVEGDLTVEFLSGSYLDSNLTVAEIGSKGGKAGTGKSKVRGDSDYYRKIRAGKKPK